MQTPAAQSPSDTGGIAIGMTLGEVYAVLQRVPGTELVEDARIFAADPNTGERGQAVQRLELGAQSLVFSYEHQVQVQGG